MTRDELRATGSLGIVFAMRLLGLFMIYPVFAGYARHLRDATSATIGLALGVYGLTQGLLQIPFGLLSDRIGRKTVISIGLMLFGVGSVVAALSTSISGMVLGRAVQGMGAISAVMLATVADLTRDEVRTKAMAIVGMTIGSAFVVALILGPLLGHLIGVPGIFWLTAGLAMTGIAIIHRFVPTPPHIKHHRGADAVPALFGRVLRDRELLRLDFAIFVLNAILTASFLEIPQLLSESFHVTSRSAWLAYVPILAASLVLMGPMIITAEKTTHMKETFLVTIALLTASLLTLTFGGHRSPVVLTALVAFFTAFNVMQVLLPSLITRLAPADAKGTATGIYSTSQFLGIFVGGAAGGWAWGYGRAAGVFGFGLMLALIWLVVAAKMARPSRYSSQGGH